MTEVEPSASPRNPTSNELTPVGLHDLEINSSGFGEIGSSSVFPGISSGPSPSVFEKGAVEEIKPTAQKVKKSPSKPLRDVKKMKIHEK